MFRSSCAAEIMGSSDVPHDQVISGERQQQYPHQHPQEEVPPAGGGGRSSSLLGMRYEEERLGTFSNWPVNAKVEARKIAKAGFFHTGQETQVQCSWCGCVLNEWDYGDQVNELCMRKLLERFFF